MMVCINQAANATLFRWLDLKDRGELGDDLQHRMARVLLQLGRIGAIEDRRESGTTAGRHRASIDR